MTGFLSALPLIASIVIFFGVLFLIWTLSNAARLHKPASSETEAPAPDPEVSLRAASSLSEMIKYPTVTVRSGSDYSHFIRLADYMRRHYPLVHRTMTLETVGGHSLLYRWKAREEPFGKPVLLSAHMDVVPAEGSWERPPFSGDMHGGAVWGRGAIDCKNTLCCLMEAAEALISSGFTPSRDIYFAFGHDEETGGADGAYKIASLLAERRLSFYMVLDEGMPVVRGLLGVRKPVARIAVTEKGSMNLRISAYGKSGHSSTPPRHSAIGTLSEAVSRVEFAPMPPRITPVVREFLRRMAPYTEGGLRYALANSGIFARRLIGRLSKTASGNAMLRTTIASTMVSGGVAPNVLPESAEVILNVRLIHGDSCHEIADYARSVVRDLDADVEILLSSEASQLSDFSGEAFKALEASVRGSFGDIIVTPYIMSAATDARKYESLSDCVFRFSPFELTNDEADTMHSKNERIRVELLGRAIDFYKRLMSNF